jgi:uncharacterized membrane protein
MILEESMRVRYSRGRIGTIIGTLLAVCLYLLRGEA